MIETRKALALICDGCSDNLAEEEFIETEEALLALAADFDWYEHDGKHYCDGCPNIPAEATPIGETEHTES